MAPAGPPEPVVSSSTLDAATLDSKWGEISTAIETRTAEELRLAALAEVRAEFPKHFDALNKHPRLLVGQSVPNLREGGDAMETLRDSKDAEEWQEALKQILLTEVQDRAGRQAEGASAALNSVHASIELFQKNRDLIPNTKQFDLELATRFTKLAQPYETRTAEGKLRGYSIPVQPLIEQLRAALKAERSAKPAAPAPAPAAPKAPAHKPQAGIASKAGAGAPAPEDFSALFGTLGMPDFKI